MIFFYYYADRLFLIEAGEKSQIWASMSLCWSENAQIHQKSAYPYLTAANLSARLWRHVTKGEVSVVLTVVYNEDNELEHVEKFADTFDSDPGIVVIPQKTTSLGCVLQSQMSRMFVFTNTFIQEQDIILTTDVDIFVMSNKIVEPLKFDWLTWIYQ